MALDGNSEVIGYELLNVGKMLSLLKLGIPFDQAQERSLEKVGRFAEGIDFIDPRKD